MMSMTIYSKLQHVRSLKTWRFGSI